MKSFLSFKKEQTKVTFPSTQLRFGDVKINGTKVGTWIQNCEMLYHAKFNFEGHVRNAWGSSNNAWSWQPVKS